MNTAQKVTNGIEIGLRPEMVEPARKFMTENGYKITDGGKRIACNDLSSLIEDVEERIALQTAIMSL